MLHAGPQEEMRQSSAEVIMKMADGSTGRVETDKDWQVLEALFKIWVVNNKSEYKQAVHGHKFFRKVAKDKFASSKEKGGAKIRHLITWPPMLLALIESVYPQQKTQDKKFIIKFINKFPMFKVPEKL